MILCIVNSVFQTLVFVPREMKRCICLAGNAISFHDLVFFCHGILPAERPRDRSRRINVFRSYLRVVLSSVLRSLAMSVTRSHVHLRPRSRHKSQTTRSAAFSGRYFVRVFTPADTASAGYVFRNECR